MISYVIEERRGRWELWDPRFDECIAIAPSYATLIHMMGIRSGSSAS
jgi:hypothetical protein